MMKKWIISILAVTSCLSMATTVFAAEINQDSGSKGATTTLTTAKEPSYTVVIPETAEITFDVEKNSIGEIEYREGNLEPDACVTVTLSEQTALVNTENENFTIPYEIQDAKGKFESVVYNEETLDGTRTPLTAYITKAAWEEAKSGEYMGTLTFTISYTDPHEASAQP